MKIDGAPACTLVILLLGVVLADDAPGQPFATKRLRKVDDSDVRWTFMHPGLPNDPSVRIDVIDQTSASDAPFNMDEGPSDGNVDEKKIGEGEHEQQPSSTTAYQQQQESLYSTEELEFVKQFDFSMSMPPLTPSRSSFPTSSPNPSQMPALTRSPATSSSPSDILIESPSVAPTLSDRPTIPTEVGLLTNLYFIDLDFNMITGSLSSELLSLSKLEQLDLNGNRMTGSINGIGVMPHLEFLQLHDNAFTGQVPESLGLSSYLGTFTLDGTHITGIMPHSVCQLRVNGVLDSLVANCLGPKPEILCPCCSQCRNKAPPVI